MGHDVTVFESRKQLGGMMRYGIPAYRFPRERLDEDIRAVLSVGGIDVKLETEVDAETMQRIVDSYDAVYLSIGAHGGKILKMDNAQAGNVIVCRASCSAVSAMARRPTSPARRSPWSAAATSPWTAHARPCAPAPKR